MTQPRDKRLFAGVVKFHARILGLLFGLLSGLAIFLVTNILLLKGGHISASGEYVVGPHLQLLSQIFIGYRVSFLGSIIGFLYAFAIGTLCGTAIGRIYNKLVDLRN